MNAAEFREAMARLPEPPNDSAPPFWDFWRHQLWQLGQSEDVNLFYKWPCVYHCMLVNHFPSGHQLLYLQKDWDRWLPVLSDVVGPDESISISNQKNLINQAYHLRKWEQATGQRIDKLGSILEFGGGYGAMALVCRRLGFGGQYLIADLPEFALLQQWWLSQQDVTVTHITEPPESPTDLLIAIYSLSEIPVSERIKWLWSDSYLFLYSGQWAEIDNLSWLRGVIEAMPDRNWHEEQFRDRPDHYAIGWPK